MKRISSLLLLTALMVLSFSSCKQNAQPAASTSNTHTTSSTNSTPSSSTGDIAYVNIDSIALYYDLNVELKAKLEDEQKKAERQFASKEGSLQKKAMSFQKRLQAGLLSENAARKEQQKLMDDGQRLEIDKQRYMQGVMAQNEENTKRIFENIKGVLEGFKEEKGYKVVLGYQEGSMVLYGDKDIDLTDMVLQKLNEDYKAEKDTTSKK